MFNILVSLSENFCLVFLDVSDVFENREHLRRRNCIAQRFHPFAAVRYILGQTRDVGGLFCPKGMSVHLRGKPISHSTQSGLR